MIFNSVLSIFNLLTEMHSIRVKGRNKLWPPHSALLFSGRTIEGIQMAKLALNAFSKKKKKPLISGKNLLVEMVML